jgi:nucleotide-binding universal stress UspA family protein
MNDRLVVATDGSSPSDAAVQLAIAMASQRKTALLFLYVVDEASVTSASASASVDPAPTIKALESSGNALLKLAAERAKCCNVQAETRLVHGDPVDAILQVAQGWDADLIVMGTHGRRGLSHLVLGSTAERVLRRSRLPVLVTKEARTKK